MPNPPDQRAPSPAGDDERGSVWVVDDSPLELDVIRRLLAPHNEVRTFLDGPSVLEMLAAGPRPDVLVVDWHMPHMSGLELCRFLRERFDAANLPILILTMTGGTDNVVDAFKAGANDFVVKAAHSDELSARVHTLVRVRVLHERVQRAELAARQARQAAEDANQAKDAFMATVSHELRTPLNSILGWAHLLKANPPDEATLQRGLDTITRNATIQIQLIDDILDTARVMSGKLRIELGPVDFSEVVSAAVDAHRPAAASKGLRLDVSLNARKSVVSGDADRLQQAVSNLLNNATKFTPAGGFIRVELTSSASGLELSVADSGKGIAPDFLPHVFDRFRQQDDSATRRFAGLGLGLALVRQLVTAHGGTVTAESEGEGKGATFRIRLPLDDASSAPRHEREHDAPHDQPSVRGISIGKLANMNLLIVEDDDDARELLAVTLAEEGATVASARTGDEALALLAKGCPDVLLSDIGLPKMDGFELIRRVRQLYSPERLPAIAFTAFSQVEDQQSTREAGFQAHVTKPAAPGKVVQLVSRVARGRAH